MEIIKIMFTDLQVASIGGVCFITYICWIIYIIIKENKEVDGE